MMLTAEKNYSNCPLKKRPFLIMDKESSANATQTAVAVAAGAAAAIEQNEPEDLSVNSSKRRRCAATVSPPPTPVSEKRCSSVESMIEIEDDIIDEKPVSLKLSAGVIKVEKSRSLTDIKQEPTTTLSKDLLYKSWPCPLTPPSIHYTGTSDSLDSLYLSTYTAAAAAARYDSHFSAYAKEDASLFKSHATLPPYAAPYLIPSMDLRTNYNNNIIKADPFINPKYFTPYRVDHNGIANGGTGGRINSTTPHRPLFNVFPLSPASSQASYNSYEQSPRRSESPMSTNSSISEQLPSTTTTSSSTPSTPSTYSVFRDVTAMSTGAPAEKSNHLNTTNKNSNSSSHKIKSEKLSKNAHYQCSDCSKSYSTYSGLSKHQQFHCPAVEGNQAKKVFSCKNCDKVYTSLGALKVS